jgi:hypothetical protein
VLPAAAVLIAAGFHVPVTPLFDVAGKAGGVELRQRGPIWVNDGISWGLITIVIVAVVAHCPADGVKV